MKHLKSFSGAILLVLVVVFIFSTTNASQERSSKFIPTDISVTCPLKITLGSGSCLTPPYYYCINGGGRVTVMTDTFTVYLNSGSSSTICVENSDHSCSGILSYYTPSPCPIPSADTTLILNKNGGACNCSGD